MDRRPHPDLPTTSEALSALQPPSPSSGQPEASSHEHANTARSIKETIESILIAFIFAFMFRAFVVEAFVIPTGSMATTLLGAHMRFTCPDCGWNNTVNYSAPERGKELDIPARDLNPDGQLNPRRFICENCAFEYRQTGTPVHYGDRILVLKYLYLFHDPDRWDV